VTEIHSRADTVAVVHVLRRNATGVRELLPPAIGTLTLTLRTLKTLTLTAIVTFGRDACIVDAWF
jgi:hypothetical protein